MMQDTILSFGVFTDCHYAHRAVTAERFYPQALEKLTQCLDQLQISGSTVLADKAHGSVHNREYIDKHDAEYCISPKSNTVEPWHCDYEHYRERHLVEAFFMKIKDCRRIAMRFEKLACRFLAFLHLKTALLRLA